MPDDDLPDPADEPAGGAAENASVRISRENGRLVAHSVDAPAISDDPEATRPGPAAAQSGSADSRSDRPSGIGIAVGPETGLAH